MQNVLIYNIYSYRVDGSYKKGVVQVSNDFSKIMAIKKGTEAPKKKYIIHVDEITDFKFNYNYKSITWEYSVFGKSGGIMHKSNFILFF